MSERRSWGGLGPVIGSLLGLSLLGVGFYIVGALRNHSWSDWYLNWNLFLGWIPMLIIGWLLQMLRTRRWSSWGGIGLTLLWLGFLPNSFYMVTDYIHLQDVRRVDLQYDAIMFTIFIATSLVLGYTSLYLVHHELRRRLSEARAMAGIIIILMLCSFAIYLGRDLRWNTWDLIINPAGVLFDVSDRIVSPWTHPHAFTMPLTLFVFLTGTYLAVWYAGRALLGGKVRYNLRYER